MRQGLQQEEEEQQQPQQPQEVVGMCVLTINSVIHTEIASLCRAFCLLRYQYYLWMVAGEMQSTTVIKAFRTIVFSCVAPPPLYIDCARTRERFYMGIANR